MQTWSGRICEQLMQWELFLQAKTIFFYYPLGNEVDLLEAADMAIHLGKQVVFPKTEGDRIQFYQVEDLSEFCEGYFHVMEPVSEKLFVEDAENSADGQPMLVLVPGVAFDRQKCRMGYGGGYYDRYLAKLTEGLRAGSEPPVKLGIAYQCQIAEKIPANSTDVPMDYILTEAGML